MKLYVGWLYILITKFYLLHNYTLSDVSINTFILFAKNLRINLTKYMRRLIKLSFNTQKHTRNLDALSVHK
jgi:hypothetical protein